MDWLLDGKTGLFTYYEYDAAGRVRLQHPNLPAGGVEGATATYFLYDLAGRLSEKVTRKDSDSSVLVRFAYTRDAAGNPIAIEREPALGAFYYQYDQLQRLAYEGQFVSAASQYENYYEYDPAGNRTLLRHGETAVEDLTYYAYDAANELTSLHDKDGWTYFAYDQNGNTVMEQAPGYTRYFDWDGRDMLVGVRSTDPGRLDVEYRYDGLGSRVCSLDSAGLTYYDWDGLSVLQERDGDLAIAERRVLGYAPRAGVGDTAHVEKEGEVYVPVTDQAGTLWDLLDHAAAKANSYAYDAFGVGRGASETVPERYRFAGKRLDPGTDVTHFPARPYAARLGRFVAREAFSTDVQNSYLYVAANPVSNGDPQGLDMVRLDVAYDVQVRNGEVIGISAPRMTAYYQSEVPFRFRLRNLSTWGVNLGWQELGRVTIGPYTVSARSEGPQLQLLEPIVWVRGAGPRGEEVPLPLSFIVQKATDEGWLTREPSGLMRDVAFSLAKSLEVYKAQRFQGVSSKNTGENLADPFSHNRLRQAYLEAPLSGATEDPSRLLNANRVPLPGEVLRGLWVQEKVEFVTKMMKDYMREAVLLMASEAAGSMAEALAPGSAMSAAWDERGWSYFLYDELSRRTASLEPDGTALCFSYDATGNRTAVGVTAAGTTYYEFDEAGRMTQADAIAAGLGTTYYEFDATGQLVRKTLGNGCYAYFAYDAARRLTQLLNCFPDGRPLVYFEYGYDAGSRITSVRREDGNVIYYGYDVVNRLTSEDWYDTGMTPLYAFQWGYDPAGNRTYERHGEVETYYTYDEANELLHTRKLPADEWTYFQYDPRGNTVAMQEPDGPTYFTYNAVNLVTAIAYKSGVANYFYYDSRMRRYAIQESTGLSYFTWDTNGMNLLCERDAEGNLTAIYAHGYTPTDGIGSMTAARKPAGETTYFQYPIYDPRGTVMGLVDQAANVTSAYEYNAWGMPLQEQESGAPNRSRYQSNWTASGAAAGDMVLSPARAYHCATGRFLQKDSDAPDATLNAYAYVPNCPLMCTDPTGLVLTGDRSPQLVQPNDLVSIYAGWTDDKAKFRPSFSPKPCAGQDSRCCKVVVTGALWVDVRSVVVPSSDDRVLQVWLT